MESLATARVKSFREGMMMMTDNAGFTLSCEDGSEFQVTVVRSR